MLMIITDKNTRLLATRMESRKNQLTVVNSSSARDMKMSAGRENVPTKVLMPFPSVSEMRFMRPAAYLERKRHLSRYFSYENYLSKLPA